MSNTVFSTQNYLVPADGRTHTVAMEISATTTPYEIDWRQFTLNNFIFEPQSAFVDNSLGVAEAQITIHPIGFVINVPAGQTWQGSFPAPSGQTASVTGSGTVNIFWTNFPVLSASSFQTVQVPAGGINVNVMNAPLSVAVLQNSAQTPEYVEQIPYALTAVFTSLAAGALNASVTIPAGATVRRLLITATSNTTAAAATTMTASLNGINILSSALSFPVAAVATATPILPIFDFEMAAAGFNNTAAFAENLTIALTAATSAGVISIAAFY